MSRSSRWIVAVLAVAVSVAALPVSSAGAAEIIDTAVDRLAESPVYVDPSAEPTLSESEGARLEDRIAASQAGPVYVAVLPAEAAAEAGGDSEEALRLIAERLGRPGTYAAVVGGEFRAGSTTLPQGQAAALATEAFDAHSDEGLEATLAGFVDRVSAAQAGGAAGGDGTPEGEESGDGTSLVVPLILLALFGGGALFLSLRRRRRAQAELEAELGEVKEFTRDDLVALGEDIRALELDTEMPDADPAAKEDYARAVECYGRADRILQQARSPEDMEPVTATLEEGRYVITSARARLEGREPPERRPPCFFDPRHGPSVRDVEWAPPWGSPRSVPACAADAQRVEDGLEPATREAMVGGQPTPYWNAGPAYGPWAGGFFGGFGGGLLPGLLLGSFLGSSMAWGAPMYVDAGSGEADAADGDFGDFGSGDFGGGGDFGGDFGGGGDF